MPMNPRIARETNATEDPRFRDCVADAVHHAVTTLTGGDGCGRCGLYALAGTVLLRELTGLPYQPQVGSMMYLADPAGNGWFHIDATGGGLARLEFHAWIGRPIGEPEARSGAKDEPDRYRIGELVDLSTRHLRTMVGRFQARKHARMLPGGVLFVTLDPEAESVEWARPDDPPPYVWANEVPDDFRYAVDEAETLAAYRDEMLTPAILARLGRLAIPRFHDLWNGFVRPT